MVNVSSHQARRPVTGALPYATAKAAVEGLTGRWPSSTGGTEFAPTPSPSARSPPSGTPNSWPPRSPTRPSGSTPS
ncbi:hypothetical protein NKG94_44695 [Micromonospora sp. M12]